MFKIGLSKKHQKQLLLVQVIMAILSIKSDLNGLVKKKNIFGILNILLQRTKLKMVSKHIHPHYIRAPNFSFYYFRICFD